MISSSTQCTSKPPRAFTLYAHTNYWFFVVLFFSFIPLCPYRSVFVFDFFLLLLLLWRWNLFADCSTALFVSNNFEWPNENRIVCKVQNVNKIRDANIEIKWKLKKLDRIKKYCTTYHKHMYVDVCIQTCWVLSSQLFRSFWVLLIDLCDG